VPGGGKKRGEPKSRTTKDQQGRRLLLFRQHTEGREKVTTRRKSSLSLLVGEGGKGLKFLVNKKRGGSKGGKELYIQLI